MNEDVKSILAKVKNGEMEIDEAMTQLKLKPYEDIGYAKIDFHRKVRQGVAEVVYGESKSSQQIIGIADRMLEMGQELVLITRISSQKADDLKAALQEKWSHIPFSYYEDARIVILGNMPEASGLGKIVIATGGTSDIPVAEEAAVVAQALGNEVVKLYDVGVAGIHRLFDRSEDIMTASVIIAIAGMEGALASVVGGMASCPVIAVPTSVGYGAAFEGLTALLSMLNACASGISVVNIDNGFGAAYLAHMINHMSAK